MIPDVRACFTPSRTMSPTRQTHRTPEPWGHPWWDLDTLPRTQRLVLAGYLDRRLSGEHVVELVGVVVNVANLVGLRGHPFLHDVQKIGVDQRPALTVLALGGWLHGLLAHHVGHQELLALSVSVA
jgi:hypothetical protein